MEYLHGHVSMFVRGYLDLEDGPRAVEGDWGRHNDIDGDH